MPANFPEVWLDRVIQNLEDSNMATWLEGIAEISANVTVINAGQISEKNKIYVPSTDFEVDVLINNNTYPIPVQEYEDGTIEITLDKYQTKVITLSDDDIIGAAYDKIDVITRSSTHALVTNKYQKAIHAIAPLANTTATPILAATGGPDALEDSSGRKRLTYEDLVEAKKQCKNFGVLRIVLNDDHWADLALDRKNFGNQLVNYVEGTPAVKIAGFELHKYEGEMPLYTAALAKKPFGSIQEATDKVASVIFGVKGVAKKTGLTKQYFTPASTNPSGQTNDLAYRHYFVATPFQNRFIGAIV